LKSNVSDYLEVATSIYEDATAKCIADVSDTRDLETIRSRVEKEGLSFLTITLPAFCSDFERSLSDGQISPSYFRSFRKYGSIPAFLRGMIGLIFNHETGRIYDENDDNTCRVDCDVPLLVDCVRQICLAFKKIELPCTQKRVHASLSSFTAIEQSFKMFSLPREDELEFLKVSSVLWGNMLGRLRLDMLVPRHGPGATAERISGNKKFVWGNWHERLEPYFPVLDSTYTLGAFESLEFEKVTLVSQEKEQPVRVTPVPKTLKGPRIIAIEPSCMQYSQQAIRDVLYRAIESDPVTAGHVNFRDQTVNQELALSSSSDGLFATIDLSDASDRVPRSLALEMFRSNPDLKGAVDACRSTRAELPDGTIVGPLMKFASMGSALCFPVESMYFYTICVAALLRVQNLPVTFANVFIVSRGIYIYGDDIVVPCMYANAVLDHLQKYNCKVNTNKTFYTGKFRESCGVDAYAGHRVTPVYLRQQRPENRRQTNSLISWVSSANQFFKKKYWKTARLIFSKVESILGPLPFVSEECSGLGRITIPGVRSIGRWNRELHRFEVKAWTPEPVYRTDRLDGYGALMKSFLHLEHHKHGVSESSDALHLERSALYGAVALKRRWVPAS